MTSIRGQHVEIDVQLDQLSTIVKRRGLAVQGRAQQMLDSEVLRQSEPYTPLLSSALIKSGALHTVIGSGSVVWKTPYARKQYYMNRGGNNGPLRGSRWFERMWNAHGAGIVRRIADEVGGEAK